MYKQLNIHPNGLFERKNPIGIWLSDKAVYFSAQSTAKTLVVSYVGMTTQELTIHPYVKVYMQSDEEVLEEVMVVAYGTAKKSAFTGSAADIKAEKIENRVVSNVTSALSGQMAGVQMTTAVGAPGSEPTIRIRGIGSMSASNAPLIILDGMPYDGSISSINPADIESMSVLKDAASSAIYGARGANGVVLINTKNGQSKNAQVTFDAKFGSNSRLIPQYDVITDAGQYYETHYKAMYNSQIYAGKSVADAYAYADANLYDKNNGGLGYRIFTVPEGEKLIGTNFKLNPNATLGYSDGTYYYTPDNWYDEAFHSSNRQEYNATVAGGSEQMKYFTSVGYLDDGGIVNNSRMQRYTMRSKVDYQAKKWLKVGANMAYTYSDSQAPAYDANGYGSSGNMFYICNTIAPIFPLYVRDAEGNVMYSNGMPVYDANQTNFARPGFVGNAVRDNEVNRQQSHRDLFTSKLYATATPVKGLTLTANIGTTVSNHRYNKLYSTFGSSNGVDGIAYVYSTRLFALNTQYLAQYKKTIAYNHNIDILAGYEQYKMSSAALEGQNDHLYNPFIGELGNAVGSDQKLVNSYTNHYMTEGFLSRVQYDYNEKYFVSASYRRDASSRFAPGHRWGNFGSAGAAWLMSKEDFMSNASWINMLKLKASYGIQGNDNLGSYYPYIDMFDVSYNSETGEYSNVMTQKGNEELTWETSYSFNAGVDFGFFKDRINGSFEYFSRKTVDLLYNKPTPLSAGIVTGYMPTNVGSILNNGIEFSLNGTLVRRKNFEWDANLNLTHYKNEILALDESVSETGIKGSSHIYKVGGSIYTAYLKQFAGVDPTNGAALYYVDPDNGDYSTTSDYSKAKQADCGSTLPDLYGGFGTSVKAYGFDFSVQCGFQLGGQIYDGSYNAFMHNGSGQDTGTNWHKDILKAWTPENTNTNVPRLSSGDAGGQTITSSRFLTSSNYLSLNNVMLGYTFSRQALSALNIASLRLYVAGENLAVLTARKGLDPRYALTPGTMTSGSGNAANSYAAMRTITAGISLTF